MEIILNKDIPKLGYKGDIVTVKSGYARNFLLPQGIAVVANSSNKKMHAELMKQAAHKLAKRKDDAQALADKLSAETINIQVKTGTTGKIFGTVTTLQVANLLKEHGFELDRRNVSFAEPIKMVGTYKAYVECYKDITAEVTLNVTGE